MANKKVNFMFVMIFIIASVILISIEIMSQFSGPDRPSFEMDNPVIPAEESHDSTGFYEEELQLPIDLQE